MLLLSNSQFSVIRIYVSFLYNFLPYHESESTRGNMHHFSITQGVSANLFIWYPVTCFQLKSQNSQNKDLLWNLQLEVFEGPPKISIIAACVENGNKISLLGLFHLFQQLISSQLFISFVQNKSFLFETFIFPSICGPSWGVFSSKNGLKVEGLFCTAVMTGSWKNRKMLQSLVAKGEFGFVWKTKRIRFLGFWWSCKWMWGIFA